MRVFLLAAVSLFAIAARTPPAPEATPTPRPSPEPILVGKLLSIESYPAFPGCGRFHLSEIADYGDITVIKGSWSSNHVRVVHGCAELPRREYAPSAGTLKQFTPGDYHRLELTTIDVYDIGRSLSTGNASSSANFFALRVDLAKSPSPSSEAVPPNPSFKRTRQQRRAA